MDRKERKKIFDEIKEIIFSKHTPMDYLAKALERMNTLWDLTDEVQTFSNEEVVFILNYIALFLVEIGNMDKKNFSTSIKGLKHYGDYFVRFLNTLKDCEDDDCDEHCPKDK